MGKTLNANFLTDSLCGVEDAQVFVSQRHIPMKKKIKKTSGHGTTGISESGSAKQLPYAYRL